MKVVGSLALVGFIVVMAACLFGAFVATIAPGVLEAVVIGGPIAVLTAGLIVVIVGSSALSPQHRASAWARAVTNVNMKYLFGLGIIVWMVYMAAVHLVVPAINTPGGYSGSANAEGGLAFVGLLAGVFIFLGFIWAVIGE
ncbi:MAG TPA: hypothetical protein VFW92_04520 [Candidatus Limnocylindrales bacterium]|nr:hypothetical protein [Candidatus Limnocylindrales bacterium]